MSEVRRRVLLQMKKTEILGNYIAVAHSMLYQEYCAFKKNLTDDPETIIENFLKAMSVQKFIYLFRKQWSGCIYATDPDSKHTMISERELFTYVLSDGIEEVRNCLRNNNANDKHCLLYTSDAADE